MTHIGSDPVARLREEHRGIDGQLLLIGHAAMKPRSASRKKIRELIGVLESRLYTHLADEERLLYSPLKRRLRENSPTDEMLREHQSIRMEFVLLSALAGQPAGKVPNEGLRARFNSLRRRLRDHFEKEEKVLFWLADSKLHLSGERDSVR